MLHHRLFYIATVAGVALIVWSASAFAQHNHAQHHNVYQNWINQLDKGCCNNMDCGEIADQNVEESGANTKV